MCMGGNTGNILTDVGLGAADVASGGTLTPALIATMAGQAAQAYAQHQQLKAQDSDTAAGLIKQGQLQKQGENDVAGTTAKIANETPTEQSNKELASYQAAITKNNANINSGAAKSGAGTAFKKAQAAATGSAGDYVGSLAKSGAVTQGTQLERVGEGQQIAGTASNLGLLQRQSQQDEYLTKLKVQSEQANPWLMGLGAAAKAYGSAASMSAGLGAGSGVGTGTEGVTSFAGTGNPALTSSPTLLSRGGDVNYLSGMAGGASPYGNPFG